jgi:hypothetical protein
MCTESVHTVLYMGVLFVRFLYVIDKNAGTSIYKSLEINPLQFGRVISYFIILR